MNIAGVVTGVVVLLLGRQLFWLFVGVIGFFAGFDIASLHLAEQSRVVILTVAILAGVAGIVIALLLQRVAFGFAGFLAGGYFLATTAADLGWVTSSGYEMVFLLGGVVGAVAAVFLTDWALIVLSSLVGAAMVIDALPMEPTLEIGLFLVLAVVGVVAQRLMFQRFDQPRVTERH